MINNTVERCGQHCSHLSSQRDAEKLTASQIRYMLAIDELSVTAADVSSSDIADMLGVTRPSVNKMLEVLSEKNLLQKERYGQVRLTDTGMAVSRDYADRVIALSSKLADSLGCSAEDAKRCAIVIIVEMPNLALR